ncbi:hypothetical protein ABZ470_31715 [Streptosporangium sp. NPDC020072]
MGKLATSLQGMLGPAQYGQLRRTNPTIREAGDLLNMIAEAVSAGDSGN